MNNLIPNSNSYSGYMGTMDNTNNNNRYGQNYGNSYYPNNNNNRYSPYYNHSVRLPTSIFLLFLSFCSAIILSF